MYYLFPQMGKYFGTGSKSKMASPEIQPKKHVTYRSGGAGAVGEEEPVTLAMRAAALYDLGLNYLVRARLACSDAGEGSGLLPQEVYQELPEVADLAR